MTRRIPVVIVGAGPVGAALAVDLGLRGVRCVLVESRAGEHRIPKGQMLAHRTLEHFHFWGLAGELRAARLMPPGYPIGEITAYGSLMGEYWQAPAGRELVRPFYFQDYERLPQYCTEAVLRRKIAELPEVDLRLGWTVSAVEQEAGGVRISIEEAGGAGREVLEADYVVGCDGAHSRVREQAGIGREGTDFRQAMVLAVFRSRELHEKLKRFPERSTFRVMHPGLNGYWMFFGRVDVGESWFFHAPLPQGADPARCDVPALIREAVGSPVQCEFDYASAIASGGYFSPATLRTAIRPTAPSASTTGSRTRSTSAGSSRRRSPAGAQTGCSIPTTPSAARYSATSAKISSPRASARTANSSRGTIPRGTARTSSGHGEPASPTSARVSRATNRTTRARRWWTDRRGATAVPMAGMNSRPAPGTISRHSRFPQAAMFLKSFPTPASIFLPSMPGRPGRSKRPQRRYACR